MIARITTRRAALKAQFDQAQAQYDALEEQLRTLDRQLCMMAGGVQELDALLAIDVTAPEEEGTQDER